MAEYFADLNYTLANEHTEVEFDLLKENAKRVFSIAGSGARCLPLLAKQPEVLDIIDMSPAQIHLCELRYESMRQLSYSDWLFFMGYRGGLQGGNIQGDSRLKIYKELKLSKTSQEFWNSRTKFFEPRGFIHLGRWESHFQKLGKIFRDYLKCDFSPVFKAQNLAEQKELCDKYWPRLRWNGLIRILASEFVFNRYLYKGHFSGSAHHRTENRPPHQFIKEEFERIFQTQLVRKNYFMQTLFLGEIRYEEGLPLEAHESTFQAIKNSPTKLNYHTGNLLELLPKSPYDFVSLSDTISYIPEQAANQILQSLDKQTPAGSRVVIRSFMRAPTQIDDKGWSRLQSEESIATNKDGTSVYQFHIYEKNR